MYNSCAQPAELAELVKLVWLQQNLAASSVAQNMVSCGYKIVKRHLRAHLVGVHTPYSRRKVFAIAMIFFERFQKASQHRVYRQHG